MNIDKHCKTNNDQINELKLTITYYKTHNKELTKLIDKLWLVLVQAKACAREKLYG